MAADATLRRSALLALAVKLLLSAGLLFFVLAKVSVGSVLAAFAKADPWLVLLWYSLFPATIALAGWRWRVLAPGLSYRVATKYTWIGVFFGHMLPGSFAGDIAKGVSLALKDSTARTGLAASIVAEKAIGLLALMMFFGFACAAVYLLHSDAPPQVRRLALLALILSLGALLAAMLATFFAVRGRVSLRIERPVILAKLANGVVAAARFYTTRPSLLGAAFLISVLIHIVNIVATYVSFRALGIDAGLLLAAVVYPVLSVVLLIPITISGIGVRDATLAGLFTLFGLSAASGVALSWLTLIAAIPNLAIGGIIQLAEIYRKH